MKRMAESVVVDALSPHASRITHYTPPPGAIYQGQTMSTVYITEQGAVVRQSSRHLVVTKDNVVVG